MSGRRGGVSQATQLSSTQAPDVGNSACDAHSASVGGFRVVLPYPPTVNTLWRRVGNKTLLSAEGRAYHERVAVIVRQADLRAVPPTPHEVEVIAYVPDRRKRDVDNILKAILDPLYRAIGLDDSVVTRLTVEKRWPAMFGASVSVTIRAVLAHGAGEE